MRPRCRLSTTRRFAGWLPALVGALALAAGCHRDMRDQPRSDPLEASDFFADGVASRSPVPGTVARGQLKADALLETGMVEGKLATPFPYPVTEAMLLRGRE